jgi:hypothetical protein
MRGCIPVLALAFSGVLTAAAGPPTVDFQRQIRPILSDKCFLCHGPDKGTRMADLRLDIQEGALAKRKNGSPIVPGKPDESLVIKRIYSDDPGFRMPPVFSHKTLTQEQKDILRRWIEQGATWKQHWAFIPPLKSALPPVKDSSWPRNDIDRFILARIENAGLQPAPEADRRTLIRRVTLDLTGLPPAPEEVQAFLKDKSPRAYERVVDRLLASPHYGEHRARYWLDAARYADTQGLHFDNYREMWPYRDWVIAAFNSNMPFDRFTVEQLAGDLLSNASLDQKIASGFQRCNVTTNEGGSIPAEVEAMYAKDRADTTGTVWLGLTVGCATCHDHKFDPISQRDYYSLTAFFRNTTQPVMDMNIPDTPPIVYVPPATERARWQELNARRDALRSELTTRRSSPGVGFDQWLASPARADAGSYASGSSLSALETDKPFTIVSRIYIPDAKEDVPVVTQYDTLNGAKPGEKKQRGWEIRIDKGNLGLYGPAPVLYLHGEDGKSLSARAAPEFTFKPKTWYHVVFTYDGSRRRQGLSMYVDGARVEVLGRGEEIQPLESSIKTKAPLTLGNGFEGGGIREFRILDRMVDEEDARLLYLSSTLADASKKPLDQLSDQELGALRTYYAYAVDPATRSIVAELHEADKSIHDIRVRSATTFIMQERTDAQPIAHVLYRGQYDQMRDEVHPNTPSVLPPMTRAMPPNRLGLAMWIVDPANPLTARVTVNRFWLEVFGAGIVKTVEDFGSQGEPPTHPEVLDWLAVDFRDSGWDVKRLFKLIVTSATYRQSAQTTPEKIARDPDNRLLARGPRFRMDAEMVRDYALFASGLLRPDIGGPSAKPYQPSNIWETVAMEESNTRFYKQDHGSDLYRRSVYTFWKRAAPPPSMDIFNAPSREVCTVRRERTNTPLQALVTMNDEQFVEAARVLAQNALEANRHFEGQVNYMARRLLARAVDKQEMAVLDKSYRDFLTYYIAAPADASKLLTTGESPHHAKLAPAKFAAMTMVANEMMNLDEVLVK